MTGCRVGRTCVLPSTEPVAGRGGLREALRAALLGDRHSGPAVDFTGRLLPDAAGGHFEGIGSQRVIAWRCHDSLSLRELLGVSLAQNAPDHSSLTRVYDDLPLEVHAAVFQFVVELAYEKVLLKGQTGGVD